LAVACCCCSARPAFGPSTGPATPSSRLAPAPPIPGLQRYHLPPNIAPLNFRVEEPGQRYRARLHSVAGDAIALSSRRGTFQFPSRRGADCCRPMPGTLYSSYRCRALGRMAGLRHHHNFIALSRGSVPGVSPAQPLYNAYLNLGIYERTSKALRSARFWKTPSSITIASIVTPF